MPTIYVDGVTYQVAEGKDLLSALITLGVDIPYFCWHPALGSVGACRQCAVRLYRNESDEKGEVEMACMIPVRDGMRVSVRDPEAAVFRKRVIEWLMVNHPHDCPICDEGGECHLQDMTVMAGHVYRRFRGRKRTYRNQDLGPFINHEMNRCIQCFRCLRFYRDYAGGRDFDVFSSKDHTYFGRFEDKVGAHGLSRAQPRGNAPAPPLQSEFSGNLIEVCPTGVFTDKTLKAHYTRKWDLETAPSVCVHCGLGCNTIPGARYQLLRRILNRFNPEINRDFICDLGRFSYEFVNHPLRLREPLKKANDSPLAVSAPPLRVRGGGKGGGVQPPLQSWRGGRGMRCDNALDRFADGILNCHRVIGIGSPRASLESNYTLRELVGEDAFFSGVSEPEHSGMAKAAQVLCEGPARSARLAEIEDADAVLLLGSDPTNEAPMLDYAIRQGMFRAARHISRKLGIPDWNDYPVREAIQNESGKLFIAAPAAMKLDSLATEIVRLAPPEISSLGWEVAEALHVGAHGLSRAQPRVNAPFQGPAGRIAAALTKARRPLIVASAWWGAEMVESAVEVTRALASRRENPLFIFLLARECNSMGAALIGGRSLDDALAEIEAGQADGLIMLENDLFRHAASKRVEAALAKLSFVAVIDHHPTRTAECAHLLLPAATFAESTGTLVNNEGRAQRFYQVFTGPGEVQPSWRILANVRQRLDPSAKPWRTCDEILAALGEAIPLLAGATDAAPPASWRDRFGAKVPREPRQYSGRTAKTAHESIFEPQPPADNDSPFTFTMEGTQLEVPIALTTRYWRPGWNSVQARFLTDAEHRDNSASGMGKRLLEPGAAAVGAHGNAPAEEAVVGAHGLSRAQPRGNAHSEAGEIAPDNLWLTPRAAIFGSDELSRMAPAIASVIPPPCVRMHPDEAAKHSLLEGETARLTAGGDAYVLPIRFDESVALGVAVVPLGYPETAGLIAPTPAKLEKAT